MSRAGHRTSKPLGRTARANRRPSRTAPRAGVQPAARRARVRSRICVGRPSRSGSMCSTDDQDFALLDPGRLHSDPLFRPRSTLDFYAFTSPVTYSLPAWRLAHLAVNMIWLAAFGSPLANRIGALRFVLFWVVTVDRGGGAALCASHPTRPGAAGRRVGRDLGHDGGGRALRLPHRPLVRAGRPSAARCCRFRPCSASRGVVTFLAVWMVINLVTGLVGFVPGDRQPDRLGGAYRRLRRRLLLRVELRSPAAGARPGLTPGPNRNPS